ncbi:MAG: YIP1 family protein [Massilia sp.]
MSGNPFTILMQMFYEPGLAFAALRQKSHAWLPLLLALLGTAVTLWYASSVDPVWMAAKLAADHPDWPAERVAQTGKMLASPLMSVWSLVATLIAYAVSALYLLLAGRVIDVQFSFGKWFAFSLWTRVPAVLVLLLSVLQVATSHGQVAMEDLNMVSLNYLLLHLAPSHPWYGLACALDLSALWSTVLTVIGLRVWTERSLATCVVVAILPMLLIFGLWATKIIAFG